MTQEKDSNDKFSVLRSQAEELLGPVSLDHEDISALSPDEIQRLVHELRVHQIELQIQNEDLRQAQLKLEELKDRYLDLYDFAPVGYVTLNDKGLILEANLTAVGLLGVERTSLVKMFFSRFVCQEFGDAFYMYLQQVFESQSEQACEIKLTRKDGTVFYAQLKSIPIQDESEHSIRCRTILTDITEHNLAVDQLNQSEEKYRLLAENMNDVIWQTTPDMVFTYVSPSIKKQRGYEPSEVLGRQIWDFIDPDLIEPVRRRAAKRLELLLNRSEAFEPEPYELQIRKDGKTLWTETSASPVFNDEGQLIAYQGVTRDITERKRVEEALQTTLSRFHIMLSSLYAGVLVTTEEGQVEFVNQAFCDLFHLEDLPKNLRGLSSPALIQKIIDVYAQPADTVSRIQAIVAHGDPVKGEEIAVRDGRVYTVDYIPINIEGKPCGRLWHYQDITERKWAEEVLQIHNQELLGVLNALDSLVYVTDMKTYEIVFINTYGQNIWGDIKGSICWQTIQVNQAGPCEFCTNSQLIGPDGNPTEGVDWEFQNTVNNRWYDCRDRAIYWPDGRIVRMEIATDITERKQAEKGEGEFEVSASPVPKNGGYRNFF